ncbi:MAG: uncharacterized protein KVP18_002038 [Porospora cf. gigantea A]|uniref:uncharacterized protein n=1 Tax=Porospora cf. gigantea A TaxID=2853593 RepID=UPI0035598099|nr:MAG: hypothetical protein KVP18_002038 [Porospora cf. gigantea A]
MSTLQIFLYKRSAEECLADLVSLYPQLSEADLVQLVNLVPRQQVEAFLCIEDCDLRFTEAEVEEILKVINSHVPESSIPSPLPSPA